jgi:hypothetical protein
MAGTYQLHRLFPLPTRAKLPQLGKVSANDYRRNRGHRENLRGIQGASEIKEWADSDVAARRCKGNAVGQSHWQRGLTSRSLCGVKGSYEHVWAKSAEFRSEAALGIYLEIEKGGGDGGSCAKSEENDEQAAAIRSEQPANDAPEHGSVADAIGAHHSPRKMGAGS